MKKINYGNWQKTIAAAVLTALVWSCFFSGNATAQTESKVISLGKLPRQEIISPLLLRDFDEALGATNKGKSQVSRSVGSWGRYSVASVEFTDTAARKAQFTDSKVSKIEGVSVLTMIDRFADVFIKGKAALERLEKAAGMVRVDGIGTAIAPPPPAPTPVKVPSKAIPDQIVRGGIGNLKGKNVIIAVLDTGVDFRHQDFITFDSRGRKKSRLLYLWDTSLEYRKGRGGTAPVSYPNTTSIGTLFTQDQLTTELRSTRPKIPATDLGGHGTACASIAAGNGNADFRGRLGLKRNQVVGVAPEADIIAVRYGENGFENDYLLNAVIEWLDKVAGAKPLVVSASYGHLQSGHDGQTVQERQMNARFPLSLQKRAFVVAAGNEGVKAVHYTADLTNKENAKWINYTAKREEPLSIYFDTNDVGDIEIETADGTRISVANSTVDYNKITKQTNVTVDVNIGKGAFRIYSLSDRKVKADLYFPFAGYNSRVYGSIPPSWFDAKQANFQGFIRAPGTMENAITVGSYDWNDNFHIGGKAVELSIYCLDESNKQLEGIIEIGKISCYSSSGPTRDGRRKPEIVAPGQYYTSSVAKYENEPVWNPDTTGNYADMNGTSAATPYTAGIVALMFQKKPTLTLGEIKNLLQSKASRDPFTGDIPNDLWGAGKLDMKAVQAIFASL